MHAFDFQDVTLNPGRWKDALDETMNFYLNIPNDNIMKYMRESVGRPAPGIYYTGWYPQSKGIALIGQWLSAYSRMYAITGKEAFREKAFFLADDFWDCYEKSLEKEPFFSSRSHYNIEKLIRAYCDLHLYCQYPNAKKYAEHLVQFSAQLTGDNYFGDNSTEWYTLSESFLDAYEIFGIEEAKVQARRFEYGEFWDLFYKDSDPFSKRPVAGLYSEFCHAYSHVNSFNSCAKNYEVAGNPYYLKALRSFYQFMQKEEVFATGGYGSNYEHLMPKYRIIDALRTGHDSFETQCDSYAAYRLCKYLTCFTSEPAYGNWVESLIYNATLSTIPMTEDGKVIYYSDYNMYGATKKNRQDGWTCCTGTRPLLMAELQRLIYFEDHDELYIDQYTPSTLTWKRQGQEIKVTQETDFPYNPAVQIRLQTAAPVTFKIHFRMPSWLSGAMTVQLNQEPLSTTVDANGWLVIEREWSNEDILTVTLPEGLWMHSFDPLLQGPNAFLYGPLVLAADYTGKQTPNDWMDVRELLPKMYPIEGEPLHFAVDGIDTIRFRPFLEYKENERYFLYHDTTAHATNLHKVKREIP